MNRPFDDDGDGSDEDGPGLVGRLLQRGAAAPNVAMKLLADQVSGWKKDFLGIFQSEIRRFLDRQDAGRELQRLIEGKRLDISIRLVDDDAPRTPRAAKPTPVESAAAPAKKSKSRKSRR